MTSPTIRSHPSINHLDSDRRFFFFFFFQIRDESCPHISFFILFSSSFLSLFFLFSLFYYHCPERTFDDKVIFTLRSGFNIIVLIIFFFFFISSSSFSFIQLFISAVTSRTVYSIKSKFQFKIREFIQRVTPRYSR